MAKPILPMVIAVTVFLAISIYAVAQSSSPYTETFQFSENTDIHFYTTDGTPYEKWTVNGGSWIVEDGILKNMFGEAHNPLGGNVYLRDELVLNSPLSMPGSSIRAKVLVTGADYRYAVINLGFQDSDNKYSLSLSPTTSKIQLQKIINGKLAPENLKEKKVAIQKDVWYEMELRWGDDIIEGELFTLDGDSFGTVILPAFDGWTTGKFSVSGVRDFKAAWFDDITIKSPRLVEAPPQPKLVREPTQYEMVETFPKDTSGKFYTTAGTIYESNWTSLNGGWLVQGGVLKNLYGSGLDKSMGDVILLKNYQFVPGKSIRAKVSSSGNYKYTVLRTGFNFANKTYALSLSPITNEIQLWTIISAENKTMTSFKVPLTMGAWYDMELRWAGSMIEGELWNSQGRSIGFISSPSVNDLSGGSFALEGIRGANTAQFDDIRIGTLGKESLVTTSPTPTPVITTPTPTPQQTSTFTYDLVETFPQNIQVSLLFTGTPYSTKWNMESGRWKVEGEVLKNFYASPSITTFKPQESSPGKSIRVKIKSDVDWYYAALLLGYQDVKNNYALSFNSLRKEIQIHKTVNGIDTTLLAKTIPSILTGTWYDMEFRWISPTEIEGELFDLNGNSLGTIQQTVLDGWTSGKFGLYASIGGFEFDDVRIGTAQSVSPTPTITPTSTPEITPLPSTSPEPSPSTPTPQPPVGPQPPYVDFIGDGGFAVISRLNRPTDVIADIAGNVFVADSGNNKIRKIGLDKIIKSIAGTGTAGYSGDNEQASQTQLNGPSGISLIKIGGIYIADTKNSRIRSLLDFFFPPLPTYSPEQIPSELPSPTVTATLTPEPSPIQTPTPLAPGYITTMYTSDSQSTGITGITVDMSGDLYISYSPDNSAGTSQVNKIDSTGKATVVAGTGTAGFSGDGEAATMAMLNSARGLAFDSTGNLYIADMANFRVRKVGLDGKISTFAGNGQICPNPVGSNSMPLCGDNGDSLQAQTNPGALVFDSFGNLYVASGLRMRKIDTSQKITTYAGTQRYGFSGDGGLATAAKFTSQGNNVAVDSLGNMFIADSINNRIRRIDKATGIITTVAGTGVAGYSGDNGLAKNAVLSTPAGVAFDSTWNLYIADTFNHRIRRIDKTTGIITTIVGTGTAGFSGDGGIASEAQLNAPGQIFIDSSNTMYVVDGVEQKTIRKIKIADIIPTQQSVQPTSKVILATSGLSFPASNRLSGIVLDNANNAYITDPMDHKVKKIDKATGTIATIAGTGAARYTGDGIVQNEPLSGLASQTIINPQAIAMDSSGNVFVSDIWPNGQNPRIRKLTPSGQSDYTISTIAGNGALCTQYIDQPMNPCGDGGPAMSASLFGSGSLTVDSSGNIYMRDFLRVRKLTPNGVGGYTITTIAGTGTLGFSGDGGPALDADLYAPAGDMNVDSSGNIFLSEGVGNRIRVLKPNTDKTSYTISTIAGTGDACVRPNPCGDGGPALEAKLWGPTGVVSDVFGNIYISDTSNMRIRKLTPNNNGGYTINTILGSGAQGSAGDGGPAYLATTSNPMGVAVDSKNNLYIVESGTNKVRVLSVSETLL